MVRGPECAFNLTRLPEPDVPTSQEKMLKEKIVRTKEGNAASEEKTQ
jgi:hypothetical protein